METFNEYINRHQTIEAEVFNLLSEYSSNDEPIEKGDSSSVFDFILPNGIKELGYEPNTQIEIKYRIAYPVISQIVKMFDRNKPYRLIVVVYEGDDFKEICKKNIGTRKIEIHFLDEFKEQVRKKQNENIKKNNAYSEEDVKETLKKRIKENRLSIFIGAGVSASAGVPTWQNLLECLCVKNGIPKIDSEIDELTKARFIIEEKYKEKGKIKDLFYSHMKDCLYNNTHKSQLLSSISTLVQKYNVESIITYNYDSLLEEEINNNNNGNKKCESIYDKTRTSDLPVYHVHGYIPKSGFHSEVVLGESEYHKIYQEAYNWGNVEQLHALCRNTCLFIGLSMKDPNLRRLIDISLEGSDVEPIHFVFLRRIEYNVPFMEKTMRSFGINCVWYNEFSDLPNLLNELCK